MPTMLRTGNSALINKIRSDGIFGSNIQGDIQSGINSTLDDFRAPLSRSASVATAPIGNIFSGGLPSTGTPPPMNVAAGDIFGGKLPTGERTAIAGTTPAQQTAGYISGLQDQGQLTQFQNALKSSGYNLDPTGQRPEDYQGAIAGAKVLYNNIFGTPTAQAPASAPVSQSFAPTGLRERALGADGQPVIGYGGAVVTGTPGQQIGPDGRALPMNQQTGSNFTLTQNPFTVPGAQPNAISPQATPATPQNTQPNAFDQNAQAFKNHIVTQQMQAGLMKSLPPGYMLDPNNNGRIMPIPGGPAEAAKIDADKKSAAQAVENINNTDNVLTTLTRALPNVSNMTAGIGSTLAAVPGTPAADLQADLKTLSSNLSVQKLGELRDNAIKNSGTSIRVTQQEVQMLGDSVKNLAQRQSPDKLRQNLEDIQELYTRLNLKARGINTNTLTPSGAPTSVAPVSPATALPAGWSLKP